MKRLIKQLSPSRLAEFNANKRAIKQFAASLHLVYFGAVSQHSGDYQVIRGLTMSPHHKDKHYTVGTYQNYDLSLVHRTDTIHMPNKPKRTHTWLIMQFDLHNARDIPYFFVGLHAHSDTFYSNLFTKFSALRHHIFGAVHQLDASFAARYNVYTVPTHGISIEQLFDEETTRLISKHFGTLTFEVSDQTLYIYAEHRRITKKLLEIVLQNGLWLAQHIDERATTQSSLTEPE